MRFHPPYWATCSRRLSQSEKTHDSSIAVDTVYNAHLKKLGKTFTRNHSLVLCETLLATQAAVSAQLESIGW